MYELVHITGGSYYIGLVRFSDKDAGRKVRQTLDETLEKVKRLDAKFFVPSHAELAQYDKMLMWEAV